MSKASTRLLVFAVLLVTPLLQMEVRGDSTAPIAIRSDPIAAQFRGCDSAGWCRFRIEALDPLGQALHTVYPDGMPDTAGDSERAVAIRNRLNALMSSFVHQHKRIVLYGLRERGDGTWAASITVNESALEEDPALRELGAR